MPSYPASVTIDGKQYAFRRILKDDFFSLNILYKNQADEGYVLKLSDFRFVLGRLFRPVAGWISRREYSIYRMVSDISGVPALGPRYGKRGYFHHFIEGETLYDIERHILQTCQVVVGGAAFATHQKSLAPDFFDRLASILQEIHQRRIFYADLNKRGNIICSRDGKPYLIDFQICVHIPRWPGWIGACFDRVFQRLIQEDLYHLYKHKQTFQPHTMTEKERQLAHRSRLNRGYRRFLWRPYITLKRLIYPHGSNDTVWYQWKKRKDQSPQMP